MRTYLLFALASILLFSCKKEEKPTYTSGGHAPYRCFVEFVDPRMNVRLWIEPLTNDSIAGWVLRKYEKNDSFNILIEEKDADSSFITSGFDWEVYMPAINNSVWISHIEFTPRSDSLTCPLGYGAYTNLAKLIATYKGDTLANYLGSGQYDPFSLTLKL